MALVCLCCTPLLLHSPHQAAPAQLSGHTYCCSCRTPHNSSNSSSNDISSKLLPLELLRLQLRRLLKRQLLQQQMQQQQLLLLQLLLRNPPLMKRKQRQSRLWPQQERQQQQQQVAPSLPVPVSLATPRGPIDLPSCTTRSSSVMVRSRGFRV